jgi:hypothetical protein
LLLKRSKKFTSGGNPPRASIHLLITTTVISMLACCADGCSVMLGIGDGDLVNSQLLILFTTMTDSSSATTGKSPKDKKA